MEAKSDGNAIALNISFKSPLLRGGLGRELILSNASTG
jgi:hypothetical protein